MIVNVDILIDTVNWNISHVWTFMYNCTYMCASRSAMWKLQNFALAVFEKNFREMSEMNFTL